MNRIIENADTAPIYLCTPKCGAKYLTTNLSIGDGALSVVYRSLIILQRSGLNDHQQNIDRGSNTRS